MPLNSTLNSSAVPSYRPDMRFQFFTCAKTFSTGTRLLECALFCAFLVAVSFLPWVFCVVPCCYPKKIVLYSHVSPVQIQAYAVVRWYALSHLSCDLSICQSLATLGSIQSGHGSFLPGILIPMMYFACLSSWPCLLQTFALARVLSLLLVFVFRTPGLYK